METIDITNYAPPATDPHKEWTRYQAADFTPSARQEVLIEVLKSALGAGLYYTSDVLAHCKTVLGITPEQAEPGTKTVEGGWFGMDCYYARGYLDARKRLDAEAKAWQKLAPQVGDKLGTLTFNDFKRNTSMVIVEILEGALKLAGKRGAAGVSLVATASQIGNAMDRAAERGQRKSGFAEYAR
jgi:hypothetical protein